MRHTLYLSILVLSLVTACTKEADMNIAKESEHTVKKNLFRVTRIEGHNDHWGDYIWIINYNKEQIESAFHIDTEGDTIGNFGISNNSDINYEIEVNDWIPKIDSDSISRLDQFLKNKYGASTPATAAAAALQKARRFMVFIFLLQSRLLHKTSLFF